MRNPFKLFVSIDKELTETDSSSFFQENPGYPIDNVIQIKLSKEYFIDLFRDTQMQTSSIDVSERYDASALLGRFENFFDGTLYNNYNSFASDISILVNNTYNDIDINPIKLEEACKTNGNIFNYFFKSETIYRRNDLSTDDSLVYDENTTSYGNPVNPGGKMLVYEAIGRELDNMISRNILSTSEDMVYPDNSYDDLDNLYTIYQNSFWDNIRVGDSVIIEGSFLLPTKKETMIYSNYSIIGNGNIPIIVQFVCSDISSYGYQVPPTLLIEGSSVFTHDITNGRYIEEGYSAYDYLGNDISDQIIVTDASENIDVVNLINNTYTILYSITNNGFTVTNQRTITYKDLTGPEIVVNGLDMNTRILSIEGIETTSNDPIATYYHLFPSATSTDGYDQLIRNDPVQEIDATTTILGYDKTYNGTFNGMFTYISYDSSGNQSTVEVTLLLVDTTPSTMNGSGTISLPQNTSYSEPGFSSFSGIKSYSITVDTASVTYTQITQLETHINNNNSVIGTVHNITYTVTNNVDIISSHTRSITIV
jgi:hypothetical protein